MTITTTLTGSDIKELMKAMREFGYTMCVCGKREKGLWEVKGTKSI